MLDASPPPTTYNLKSDFVGSPTHKAFSFGISRDAYQNVSLVNVKIKGLSERASTKR